MMFQKTRFNQILRPILEPNSQRWVFRNTEVLMSGRYLSPEDEGLEPENGEKNRRFKQCQMNHIVDLPPTL